MQPQPTEKEIQFILDAISEYLTVKVHCRHLVSADTTQQSCRHGSEVSTAVYSLAVSAPEMNAINALYCW